MDNIWDREMAGRVGGDNIGSARNGKVLIVYFLQVVKEMAFRGLQKFQKWV